MDTQPCTSCTSYVSRVVALPSGVAAQVFDACRTDRQYRSPHPGRWTVPAGPTAFLALDGAGLTAAPAPGRSWALRTVPGRLHTARLGGTYDVELELNPWSAARTEVGIRLVGRRRPNERYVTAAGAIVDGLASDLELRGLLALHPSHTTGTTSRQEVATSAWL